MILLKLFWAFLQIGLFSIGGGLAAMPLIQSLVLEKNGWITAAEFSDLITISEMTPGPIGINAASFVGARIAGIPGAVCATLGFILPACLIVSLIAWLYVKYSELNWLSGALRGLRPAVVGMIASAALTLLTNAFCAPNATAFLGIDWAAVLLFLICFWLLRKSKPSPILVMCLSGAAGFGIYTLTDLL